MDSHDLLMDLLKERFHLVWKSHTENYSSCSEWESAVGI